MASTAQAQTQPEQSGPQLMNEDSIKPSNRITVPSVTTALIIFSLLVHAIYINYVSSQPRVIHHHQSSNVNHAIGLPTDLRTSDKNSSETPARWVRPMPELFIFRRTKKTGTSSMLAALVESLRPLGYNTIWLVESDIEMPLRHEFIRTEGRRIMLLRHNHVTKSLHPTRSALIADTIRDGIERMTSFCRYFRKINTCNVDEIRDCWLSEEIQAEKKYRWAGRQQEDDDTYIDLPLSSAHPGLSTTVMRTVFPNVTLKIEMYNVRESTCEKTPELRALYDEIFPDLDEEDNMLRKRMLMIAGYPFETYRNMKHKLTFAEMLDAADTLERAKYGLTGEVKITSAMSPEVRKFRSTDRKWLKNDKGIWVPATKNQSQTW